MNTKLLKPQIGIPPTRGVWEEKKERNVKIKEVPYFSIDNARVIYTKKV